MYTECVFPAPMPWHQMWASKRRLVPPSSSSQMDSSSQEPPPECRLTRGSSEVLPQKSPHFIQPGSIWSCSENILNYHLKKNEKQLPRFEVRQPYSVYTLCNSFEVTARSVQQRTPSPVVTPYSMRVPDQWSAVTQYGTHLKPGCTVAHFRNAGYAHSMCLSHTHHI